MKGRETEKRRDTLYIYTSAYRSTKTTQGEGRLEQIQSIRIQKK